MVCASGGREGERVQFAEFLVSPGGPLGRIRSLSRSLPANSLNARIRVSVNPKFSHFANAIKDDGHMDTVQAGLCLRSESGERRQLKDLLVKGDGGCPGLAKGPFVGSSFAWAGWTGQGTVPPA